MSKVDEAQLAEECSWWWRQESEDCSFDRKTSTIIAKTLKGRLWTLNTEPGAWRYELARRHKDAVNQGLLPYPKMDKSVSTLLQFFTTAVCQSGDIPLSQNMDVWDEECWSDALNLRWNLRASDDELVEYFLELIKKQRKEHKFSRSKARWRRTRALSWRWPEVLDISFHCVHPALDENDRSKLSQARKEAKRWFDCLCSALHDECEMRE